jgi:hypothetical protein
VKICVMPAAEPHDIEGAGVVRVMGLDHPGAAHGTEILLDVASVERLVDFDAGEVAFWVARSAAVDAFSLGGAATAFEFPLTHQPRVAARHMCAPLLDTLSAPPLTHVCRRLALTAFTASAASRTPDASRREVIH